MINVVIEIQNKKWISLNNYDGNATNKVFSWFCRPCLISYPDLSRFGNVEMWDCVIWVRDKAVLAREHDKT